MTIHVNIGEAKTRLSELIVSARRGEEVVISRAGEPAVRLVPVEDEGGARAKARMEAFGMYKHAIDPALADSLLEPMSDEDLALWYDAPIFPDEADDPAAR